MLPEVANAVLQPVIARANIALERGQAASTIDLLAPLHRTPPSSLTRDDEWGLRVMLVESYLLQGDLAQCARSVSVGTFRKVRRKLLGKFYQSR